MDPHLLRQRAHILEAIRSWFSRQGYLEVHTPTLVPAGAMEPHLEPIQVGQRQLHTSPEFAMKRVLASGLGRIYQIAPCFREEEEGVHHTREFTMLEWYRVGAGTPELMDEVEDLIATAARAVQAPIPHFDRIQVASIIDGDQAPEDWFFEWVDRVEPDLSAPTIVWGYPAWQAALARTIGTVADRFEVYLGGLELANAFAEEQSSAELRQRIQHADDTRRAHGRRPHPIDPAFLHAVDRMPRCAGIALGIDRLVMALTRAEHICDVQVPSPLPSPVSLT